MDVHSLAADPKFTAADPLGSYDFTVAADSPAVGLGYASFPMTGLGAPIPPRAVFAYGGPASGMIVQPDMLMGATATNIPPLAVQSSLGLTKPHGLCPPSVPQGSYAATGVVYTNTASPSAGWIRRGSSAGGANSCPGDT